MVESDKINAAKAASVACVYSAARLSSRLASVYFRGGRSPESIEQLDRFQAEAAGLYGTLARGYGRLVATLTPDVADAIAGVVLAGQSSYEAPRFFNQVAPTWHAAVFEGIHRLLCLPLFEVDPLDSRFDDLDDRIRERDFGGLEAALEAVDGEDRADFWRRVVDAARASATLSAPSATGAPPADGKTPTKEQGWLSCSDLATKHKVSADSLRKRLERWRRKHADGWMEVGGSERGTRDAQFLYRESAVLEVIRDMANH